MLRLITAVVALAALLLGGLTVPAQAGDPALGRLWAKDKILKRGCHDYRYQYRVRSPQKRWALETFLRDPSGEIIASNVFGNATHPKRGSSTFRFCRYSTRPGKFKIKGKLTRHYTDRGSLPGPLDDTERQKVGWVKPGYFRMRLRS